MSKNKYKRELALPRPTIPNACECGVDPFLVKAREGYIDDQFYVWCRACNKTGPTRYGVEAAVYKWNNPKGEPPKRR